jgi:hypothetical protein
MKRSRGNEGKELDAKIEEFRTKMRDKSMDLFNVKFSEKLALLSSVFESELFCMDVAKIHNAGAAGKKAKVEEKTFEEGTNEVLKKVGGFFAFFFCFNFIVKKVVEIVKKELAEFVESVSTIKVWIQLLTPSIADGNNFGVSVQEECITEFARAEGGSFFFLFLFVFFCLFFSN